MVSNFLIKFHIGKFLKTSVGRRYLADIRALVDDVHEYSLEKKLKIDIVIDLTSVKICVSHCEKDTDITAEYMFLYCKELTTLVRRCGFDEFQGIKIQFPLPF